MYLAAQLTDAGFPPKQVRTSAKVHLEEGPRITLIELDTEAEVPNVDEKTFQEKVDYSKKHCPISPALRATLQWNALLIELHLLHLALSAGPSCSLKANGLLIAAQRNLHPDQSEAELSTKVNRNLRQ